MTHATRKTTLELHLAGLLSDLEALELLDGITPMMVQCNDSGRLIIRGRYGNWTQPQTHGSFRDDGSYIGYDYAAQLWVDTA